MSDSEAWAVGVRSISRLNGDRFPASADEPSLLVQRVTKNLFLCEGPVEHFSNQLPIWVPPPPDDDQLRPIDILYGKYDPRAKSIEIYIDRIRQDAKTFRAESDELLEIVRIHEYAHALVHLGVNVPDGRAVLSDYGSGTKTDWSKFASPRDAAFGTLTPESHDLLAQAITWACLVDLGNPLRRQRLQEVFNALEAKQPAHYKLSTHLKDAVGSSNWPLVLEAARGSRDVFRGPKFDMTEGLRALIRQTAEHRAAENEP